MKPDYLHNLFRAAFSARSGAKCSWNMSARMHALPLLSALSLFANMTSLNAQSYSIDWFTVDGGGGTSTGGVYSVSGTIGQPDAGKMSGGNFTVDGGFWGITAAVLTPGAPLLTITRTTTN